MGYLLGFWIIIGIAAIAIDVLTSSFLFVWFCIGAIAAIIALINNQPAMTQIIAFVGVSAAFMAVGYPIVKKNIKKTGKKVPTMEENYIGQEITVNEDIEEKGKIKMQGIYWTVKNIGKPLKKGEKVKIVGIEGNKLVIQEIKFIDENIEE